MSRIDDLNTFYALLGELRQQVGGFRYLRECTAANGWPERGVYFFFEPGEAREDGSTLRVTRVGTHAVSEGSATSLWDRLHTHRGNSEGGGNHRGSIFRKRVGQALLKTGECPVASPTWGIGNSAKADMRSGEEELEHKVSLFIGALPFLWLEVDDTPSPKSQRAYIERNAIALLSNWEKEPIDPPSAAWLGNHSSELKIRHSGLWNSDHVDATFDPRFLDTLSKYIRHDLDVRVTEPAKSTCQPNPDSEWGEDRLAKVRALIRQLYAVVSELESEFEGRKFTPDGHLVGSIGEVVAAYVFGLKLLPASNEVHDAEAADGTLVQIKFTGGTTRVSLYSEPVHLIVLQLTGSEFRTVYNGSGKTAWNNCGAVQKNGQRTINLAALRRLNGITRSIPQIRDFPSLS